MNRSKILQETASFSLIVLIAIWATRIWTISFFYFFGVNSQIGQSIANDPFHHYHLGLILIAVAILFHKHNKAKLLAAVGLGIFLEEWAVFLNDLGLHTTHLYLTTLDVLIITSLVGLVYILSKALFNMTPEKT